MLSEIKLHSPEQGEFLLGHSCGVIGIIVDGDDRKMPSDLWNGLMSLQHRGQEAAGIAYTDGNDGTLRVVKNTGLLAQAVPFESVRHISTQAAIGHVRYSVTGGSSQINIQPYYYDGDQPFALCHNGNVAVNTSPLSGEPTSDTYAIGKNIAAKEGTFEQNTIDTLRQLNGAYTLLFLTNDGLYAALDPWNMRPPVVGTLTYDHGKGYVIASETVALNKAGATFEHIVSRGSLVKITPSGCEVVWTDPRVADYPAAACSFERAYFADAASQSALPEHGGLTNHSIRVELGRRVAATHASRDNQFVAPIPNSGWSYAEGAAEELTLPIHQIVQVNRFAGRNFIQPQTPSQRQEAARLKYNFIPEQIDGAAFALVDDSIVRANTTQGITLELLRLGAQRIEYLIGMPPVRGTCQWGIDFQREEELIYNQLMRFSDRSTFEERLALWLVGGDGDLSQKVRVSFQRLEDFISIVQAVPQETPAEQSGGCFHCFNKNVPAGLIYTNGFGGKERFEV